MISLSQPHFDGGFRIKLRAGGHSFVGMADTETSEMKECHGKLNLAFDTLSTSEVRAQVMYFEG